MTSHNLFDRAVAICTPPPNQHYYPFEPPKHADWSVLVGVPYDQDAPSLALWPYAPTFGFHRADERDAA